MELLTVRNKAQGLGIMAALAARGVIWLFGWVPGREWTWAFAIGAAVAFWIVTSEVDAIRAVYGFELAKVRQEANRDAVIDPKTGVDERRHMTAYLDGWNKYLVNEEVLFLMAEDLHAKVRRYRPPSQ